MATTTARQHTNRYWNMVKNMNNAEKLELMSILIDSMKPAVASPCRYTLQEMNALLDEAEADIAAGRTISHEEMMREWEEEIARVEQARKLK